MFVSKMFFIRIAGLKSTMICRSSRVLFRHRNGRLLILFILLVVVFVFVSKRGQSSANPTRSIVSNRRNTHKLHVSLLIMICTAAKNDATRDAIRSSWRNFVKGKLRTKVAYRFIVGTKEADSFLLKRLENEGPDLVTLPDVLDRYDQLTQKTLSGLTQMSEEFAFDFLLKVDDDSFVNVPQLSSHLERLSEDSRSRMLYLGYFSGNARVKKAGKWAESDWMLSDRYLPYARGGGYILGSELVLFLTRNSGLLKLYSNEDVAVGAWLAGVNVWYMHDRRFDTEYLSRGCSNDYLVTHKRSQDEMMQLYDNWRNRGKLCEREVGARKSYDYNWSVAPSECCIPDRFDVQQ